MSSATPHRFQGSRSSSSSSSSSLRYQKKFVPKSTASSSCDQPAVSSSAAADPSLPPPRRSHSPLTTSLRESSKGNLRGGVYGGSRGLGNFVSYLPQDEAVAAGLGADAGGLDAVESQAVVDLLNDELARLLKLGPRDFWSEVAGNDSLHEFLDGYLQFRHRWYDFPHRGSRGIVAGVIVGELELCRRVFMILYRISSNKDPGAHAKDGLSMKEHTALLKEKKLLDLPKLLDICAIYGHENADLTRSLVNNAILAQPKLLDDIASVIAHFLNITYTMHERCRSSLEVLIASGDQETHGHGQLYKDFLEVMDFINDTIVTLDAFADAYPPANLYFSVSFEMSYGVEDLLKTLARLHDSLLPALQKGFFLASSNLSDGTIPSNMLTDMHLSLRMLSSRIVRFGWRLLDFCYLSHKVAEHSFLQSATKIFPAKVDDPAIRGDILLQSFKEINAEISYNYLESNNHLTFLQNLENEFRILNCIDSLRNKGWIFIDEQQFMYLTQIALPPNRTSWEKESVPSISSLNEKALMEEDDIILESKISQIKDLFPDYGKGFLSACLEVYNQNPEEVIQRILEGNLHEDLVSLNTTLELVPPPKQTSIGKSDKGKGVLLESTPLKAVSSIHTESKMQRKDDNGPSSSSSSMYGRYTRKSNDDVPDTLILNSKAAKDAVRSVVLASEYEYEDEYDDSFDDLGLSLVESGYEETENLSGKAESIPGVSSDAELSSYSSNSNWSSQKKPQFYVKDGKNYSYKVSGSVSVKNAREAAIVNQAQKETIYGLGRGGNIPLGAVKKLIDADDRDNQTSHDAETSAQGNSKSWGRGGRRGGGNVPVGSVEPTIPEDQDNQHPGNAGNSGRGYSNSRGRGGRRGGGNHHRKERALRKTMSGMGGN